MYAGTQNVEQILETVIQGAGAFPDPSVGCLLNIIISSYIIAILGPKDMLWNFEKVN